MNTSAAAVERGRDPRQHRQAEAVEQESAEQRAAADREVERGGQGGRREVADARAGRVQHPRVHAAPGGRRRRCSRRDQRRR